MQRSARSRVGAVALLVIGASLPFLAIAAGRRLPDDVAGSVVVLLPVIFMGFAVFTTTVLLAAGGGNELVPTHQLVAFPVSSRTVFASTLLLIPTNLAWLLQVLLLFGVISYTTAGSSVLPTALIATAAYIAAVTVVAALLAWGVNGLRARPRGRRALLALALVAAVAVVLVQLTGRAGTLLDLAPTRYVVIGLLQPLSVSWLTTLLALGLLAALGYSLGWRVVAWSTQRQATDRTSPEAKHFARRRDPGSDLLALLRADHASLWRSRPIRRGILMLGLVPAVAVALTALEWEQAVFIPGLLAAGAALLFGVNAIALDGPGTTWLASLPLAPRDRLLSRTILVAESCLVPSVLGIMGVALGAAGAPSVPALVATLAAVVATTASITATAIKWSVNHPYGAPMHASRDTPAPPGAMLRYSLLLAARSTWIGGLLYAGAALGSVSWTIFVLVCLLLAAAHSLTRSFGRWADSTLRAQVTSTVAQM